MRTLRPGGGHETVTNMPDIPDTTEETRDPSDCEKQSVGHDLGVMDKSVLIGEPRPHDWPEDFEHE